MVSTKRIAAKFRVELRDSLRLWDELREPLGSFSEDKSRPADVPRWYVNFDLRPHRAITGLRISPKRMQLPDEPICARTLEFAKSVWHLKDYLANWMKKSGLDRFEVEQHAKRSQDLLVCADLANRKKHGENRNRSKIDPQLGYVWFDTQENVPVEYYLDGATKEKELLVTRPVPISYSVPILLNDGTEYGDAVTTIKQGFEHWLPLIKRIGLLDDGDAESDALKVRLFGNDS